MNNNPRSSVVSGRNWGAFQIALLYLTIGVLWILFSDEAAARLAPNQAVLTQISIYKGWGYVLVTALLLYWMIRLHTRRINQTKLTLSESEKSYQELLQQASDGIFIADAKGNYTLVNEEACRLVGYTKDELLSMNLRELIAPEDLQNTPPRLDELRNGKTLLTERKLLRKDGSPILCEISAKQLADGRYQSIVRDITERKVTEAALRRSEKRYRSLFENMTNGFARCQMLYDESGAPKDFIYLDVNQAFENLTGLKNVLGKRISAVIPGIHESNPELFEIYGRVALTGKPEKFETYVPGLGAGIWFSVSVYSTEKGFFVTVFETITERKQAETALRENEERLRLSLHAANQGLYDLNVQTGDAIVNREYAEMLGYDPDAFVETNAAWIERLHPDDREITANAYADYIKGLTPEYRVEFRQKTKAGDWKWILSLGKVAEFDATGKPLRMLGTHTDITERRQVEEKLRDSEEQYRLMFTNNPLPMWVFDRETFAFLAVNDATVAQYGYSREEFMKMTIKDIRPPEDIPALQKIVATKSEPYLNVGVYRHRKKDGTLIDVEITRHDVLFDGREALIILANDVTERKQAEEAQHRSEARLNGIITSAMDAIISVDSKQTIVLFNAAAEKMFGYPASEAVGGSLERFIPERFRNVHRAHISTFGETGVTKRAMNVLGVILGLRANGEEFPIEASLSLIEIDNKKLYTVILRDITERKRAEAQLEYQAHLLRQINDAVIAVDSQFHITAWNEAAEKMYGWRVDEVHGSLSTEIIRSDMTGEKRNKILSQLHELGSYRSEVVQYRKDGSPIHVEANTIALYDKENKFTGLLSVNRDINERKQAEALQSQLAAIVDSSEDAIIGKTLEDIITSWNVGAERLYGYSAAEVIGQPISLLIPSDRKDELSEILTKLKRGESIKHFETERQRKNGTRLFVSLTISPIKDAISQITGASTIARDITDRKQAEEALHRSQENFAKAFNSNPAAIAITRLVDGKFISLNAAYTRIMEYEPDELLGHTAAEMNIYVYPEERAQMVQQLREQGTVQNYELLVRTKSGETRSIVVSMEPILYNAEECILSVFIDISERKKMELELQRSNAELEQFAYVASHDLQEPLRAVAGMVQLLQQRYQGKLDERADEYIGHAVESSTRMQNLINDLLEYSRVERFGKPLAETDLESCLKNALANLQVSIQESNAQITHTPLPVVRADATQLTQVLQNLIGNAIKFRGARPLHIHIGAKKIKHNWQFEVSDNGIGIESQYFERIFRVFQRLHARREYPGTGIGLSLCKKIIERHGGQIWLESQPGAGSTFYFALPERL